ncbi:MAG TPA: hypothetical protein VN397_04505 [Candidatus Methylomirabilis sp.]|nr:hypothetical protein [Candidatus Methylomirabilis sp.]
MKRSWTPDDIALPFFLVLVAAIAIPLAFVMRARLDVERGSRTVAPSVTEQQRPVPPPQRTDGSDASLDEIACRGAGGRWNPCGSACRGASTGTVCIQVCVPQCECGGIAGFGCPDGFVCSDLAPPGASDAMGICAPRAP